MDRFKIYLLLEMTENKCLSDWGWPVSACLGVAFENNVVIKYSLMCQLQNLSYSEEFSK